MAFVKVTYNLSPRTLANSRCVFSGKEYKTMKQYPLINYSNHPAEVGGVGLVDIRWYVEVTHVDHWQHVYYLYNLADYSIIFVGSTLPTLPSTIQYCASKIARSTGEREVVIERGDIC